MKKLILVSFFLIFILCLNAQDVKQGLKIPSTYDRSAITFVLLNFPSDYHSGEIIDKIGSLYFADKFYNNNISYLILQSPFNRNDLTANKNSLIQQSLENNKIANEIIKKWYSVSNDGTMSLDLIHERGMFNATDATFLLAKTTKRGNAQLEDYGNRLINRSYILVLDYQDVLTMAEARQNERRGWKSNVMAYLYKIDYNQDIQNKVYDAWIYEDDTPETKANKKLVFEQIQFPINFVTQTFVSVDASQNINRTSMERILFPDKTPDQLLEDLVQKGYDENLYSLEKKVEDFKVKTTITQKSPLTAKIGKKEGLKTDNRFYAYEYVLNESDNTTKQEYRGIIRSTAKIVDNRQVATGAMGTTTFYQTAGKQLEIGYLIQQRNDNGIEISLGLEYGDINGFYGRIDYRLGRFIGIKSSFVYLEASLDGDDSNVYRYGIGIAKGIQLTRNIELRPYGGLGSIKNTQYEGVVYKYYKVGANLNFNLIRNFQLYAGASYCIIEDSGSGLSINGGIKLGF